MLVVDVFIHVVVTTVFLCIVTISGGHFCRILVVRRMKLEVLVCGDHHQRWLIGIEQSQRRRRSWDTQPLSSVFVVYLVMNCQMLRCRWESWLELDILCWRPQGIYILMHIYIGVLVYRPNWTVPYLVAVSDETDADTTCLCVRISNITFTNKLCAFYITHITHSDRSPILAKSAVQSNITSWQLQKISRHDLNKSIELTSTTWLGKLFQIFTILNENEYFLISSRKLSLISLYITSCKRFLTGGNLYWYWWIAFATYNFINLYHVSSNSSIFQSRKT